MENFDSLWNYCKSNNRVIPKDWNRLYNMLRNKKQKPNGGWLPSAPLILAAWHVTLPFEKHLRFEEHVKWSNDNGQIEEIGTYLRSLREDEWYHYGEL